MKIDPETETQIEVAIKSAFPEAYSLYPLVMDGNLFLSYYASEEIHNPEIERRARNVVPKELHFGHFTGESHASAFSIDKTISLIKNGKLISINSILNQTERFLKKARKASGKIESVLRQYVAEHGQEFPTWDDIIY